MSKWDYIYGVRLGPGIYLRRYENMGMGEGYGCINEWIDPKDKLPENNKLVAIYVYHCVYIGYPTDEYGYITIGRYTDEILINGKPAWVKYHENEAIILRPSDVKYWMLLPEVPK